MSRRVALQLSRGLLRQPQRRWASEGTHAHSEPVNESFGRGFYLTLAAIPFSFAVYKISTDVAAGEDPFVTRWMKSYDHWYRTWAERNEIHTKMVEQAGYERLILTSSPRGDMEALRYNEIFNQGSPYNVPAGSRVNLDKVIEHYNKLNAEVDVERERIKERRKRREEKEERELEERKAWRERQNGRS